MATVTFEETRRESRGEEEEIEEEEVKEKEEEEEVKEKEEEVKEKGEEKEEEKGEGEEDMQGASPPATTMSSSTSKLMNAFTTWTTALLELGDNQEVGGLTKNHTPSLLTSGGEVGTKRDIFLPPVHSLSVTQVQRNIFMGQLKRRCVCVLLKRRCVCVLLKRRYVCVLLKRSYVCILLKRCVCVLLL